MGKELDPLPGGVRVAVVLLRVFSWPLVAGAVVWLSLAVLLSWALWMVESSFFWTVDQAAVQTTVLFATGLAMRTFADGIEQAHRQREGLTDAARWLGYGLDLCLWCRIVTGWLAFWHFGNTIAIANTVSERSLEMALVLLGLHVGLFVAVVFAGKWLQKRSEAEADAAVRSQSVKTDE
ncbi:MAG: hypothetical protein QM755_24475 [Luteolibacter sp.]